MKKIAIMVTITIMTIALGSAICGAEPNNVTRYLITEPMSMMDWGIYNLKERIQKQVLEDAKKRNLTNSLSDFFYVQVSFDIDKNQIIILVSSLEIMIPSGSKETVALSIEEAKQWSKRVIFAIKDNLGVDPKTGRPNWGDDSTFIYSSCFSHKGWVNKKHPLNINKEVDQLIVIQTESLINKGDEKLICFSRLTDEEIFCSEPVPFRER